MKRTDYINWDEYFMGIALLTAMRSKDPSSQVGACIVSPENKILSLGYNGMPIGCDDDAMPWDREGDPLDTKYMYVCHAELNAILNSAHNNLKGARVYVTLFPCNECAKAIIQSGISEVVPVRSMKQALASSPTTPIPALQHGSCSKRPVSGSPPTPPAGGRSNWSCEPAKPLTGGFFCYIIEAPFRINIQAFMNREGNMQ